MPAALLEAVVGAAGWEEAFFFIAGNAAAINTGAFLIASYAYGQHEQQRLREAAKRAANDAARDRQVMIRSAIAPRPVVYGRKKISGLVAYAQSTGTLGQYLHLVVAFTGHECDAIETIYFNDVALPAPDAGTGLISSGVFTRFDNHTGLESTQAASIALAHTPSSIELVSESDTTATGDFEIAFATPLTSPSGYTLAGNVVTFTAGATGRWRTINYTWQTAQPRVRIRTHLGSLGQVADTDLIAESGGKWTTAHRGAGVCYVYARLEYDQDIFGQIGLPNISAMIRGKKVRDPRTGLTVWSDNAALCVADWLLDPVFGLGCTSSEVPDIEIITAANICDEDMSSGDYYIIADEGGNLIGDDQANLIGGI